MKDVYYYASVEFEAFDAPQPNREALTTSMLTRSMLDFIWQHHSTKFQKYRAVIPKSVIHDLDDLKYCKFDIEFVNDFEGTDPIAEAKLYFDDCLVHLFCRRQRSIPEELIPLCEPDAWKS